MIDLSPLNHPLRLRWVLEAREELLALGVCRGDAVFRRDGDTGGRVVGESLTEPGMIEIEWNDGGASQVEPWDVKHRPAFSQKEPLVDPVELEIWARSKGLR